MNLRRFFFFILIGVCSTVLFAQKKTVKKPKPKIVSPVVEKNLAEKEESIKDSFEIKQQNLIEDFNDFIDSLDFTGKNDFTFNYKYKRTKLKYKIEKPAYWVLINYRGRLSKKGHSIEQTSYEVKENNSSGASILYEVFQEDGHLKELTAYHYSKVLSDSVRESYKWTPINKQVLIYDKYFVLYNGKNKKHSVFEKKPLLKEEK